jgi:hypothetical protein
MAKRERKGEKWGKKGERKLKRSGWGGACAIA